MRELGEYGKNIKEVVWCNHIRAFAGLIDTVPVVSVRAEPLLNLVVEETKIKLLCGICLMKALEIRQAVLTTLN